MINKMKIDQKILSEINRYHSINKYILEQDVPPTEDLGALPPAPAPGGLPNAPTTPPGEVSPIPPGGGEDPLSAANPQPIDVEADEDVTAIDDEGDSKEEGEGDSEELDITDLVTTQKSIESKQNEYFNNLFAQIDKLEQKLANMDTIFDKLNAIDSKVEKYREKTPEEKLELRTYDSYPFNQKLSQFFDDKQVEMEKSGKNEYVLTSDDITNINPNEIKDTFGISDQEDDDYSIGNNNMNRF